MGDLNIDGAIWGITAILLFIAAGITVGVLMLHSIKEQLELLTGKQTRVRMDIKGTGNVQVFDQDAA